MGSSNGAPIYSWLNAGKGLTSWRNADGTVIYSDQIIYVSWLTNKPWCKTDSQGSVGLVGAQKCAATKEEANLY